MEEIFIAFDTETTDLMKPEAVELFKQPFMIEIYSYKFRFIKEDSKFKIDFIDEYMSLFKPPVPVSEKITEITGITNEMLEFKKPFISGYDDMCDFFLGATHLVAHNCSFDVGILSNELKRHGLQYNFPWPKNHICTVEKTECIQNKRLKLKQLYQIATGKEEFPNAHRAAADVMAMVECIEWMKNNKFL